MKNAEEDVGTFRRGTASAALGSWGEEEAGRIAARSDAWDALR